MRAISRRFCTLFLCAVSLLAVSLQGQTVSVTPKNEKVGVGLTRQYTATVQGLSSSAVTWSVGDSGAGNAAVGFINSTGLYTAPANLPAQNPVTIRATGSDGKTAGTVYALIAPLGPNLTSIAPNPLPVGSYSITVNGAVFVSGAQIFVGAVQLSTTFVSPTTLKADGYQGTAGTMTVRVINPGSLFSNSLTATFSTANPAITVAPATASVVLGATRQFTASGQSNVTWSAAAGTISAGGLYTAPAVMPASNIVAIKATGTGGQVGSATVTLVSTTPTLITVAPAAASVVLGATQQFTASGQANVTWSATAGTISAGGLYTAPAAMPASSTVTIKATGTGNQVGTATVTLANVPPAAITVAPATSNVALGATQQFTAPGQSAVTWSATAGTITAGGLFTAPGVMPVSNTIIISAKGSGNQVGTGTVILTGVANPQVSAAAARRFLQQAAFGATPADAAHVQTIGYKNWLAEQFAMPKVSNYTGIGGSIRLPNLFLANAVSNPDQLRQRVAFAMSQIYVVSLAKLIWPEDVAPHEELLLRDAFANYRQVLEDVTLSGPMGMYLDMANNQKANPSTGAVANENYAREIMQLFSMGTVLLNPDGTRQTDATGAPIPAYNQTNVTELARVFTGWTYAPTSGSAVNFGVNFQSSHIDMSAPMVPVAAMHDNGSKNLLNGFVSPAGITPQQDLKGALDNIFAHQNVAPFICKQMIQHLVKSNPTPAYVARVVAVFADNGLGVRGDMQAVITAILLDAEARANDNGGNDLANDGHLQEPALYLTGIVRALNGKMTPPNYFNGDLANMGQDIFDPASVFNYYSPGYTIPATTLKGGEFQIYNTYTSVYRANLISGLFSNYSNPVQDYGPGTSVDLTPYVALANTPTALVDALDNALTGGVLPAQLKQTVVTAVQAEPTTNPLVRRVQTAIYLIVTSNYYNVWH